MWRYLLRRDDEEPAPWTKEGKDRMKKLGLTMQVLVWDMIVVPPGNEFDGSQESFYCTFLLSTILV